MVTIGVQFIHIQVLSGSNTEAKGCASPPSDPTPCSISHLYMAFEQRQTMGESSTNHWIRTHTLHMISTSSHYNKPHPRISNAFIS